MALTLPYPGLVFVPLDILTAEEQNEIVANYTYIANQFPIAASNIDFSTFPKTVSVEFDDYSGNPGTSATVIQSKTLGGLVAGQKYLAIAKFQRAQASGTGVVGLADFIQVGIMDGTIRFLAEQTSPVSVGIFTASSSSISVSLRAWSTSGGVINLETPTVYAIPIQTEL